jgi:N-acetylglucosaminyldiphosphoundecaprenol N-acetyl-beta-D-mannosaminyltransferase
VEATESYQFAGVDLQIETISQACKRVLSSNDNSSPSHFHLCAASTLVASQNSVELVTILNDGISYCDSKPLSKWISYIGTICPQIRGVDLFREVLRESNPNIKHFLLGGRMDVLNLMIDKINLEFTNVKITGAYSPAFGIPTQVEIIEWAKMIQMSGADIVWVGLGSPKQDFVSAELSKLTQTNVVAIGAAFDFFADNSQEAPLWIRKISLEWLFRLFKDPIRLWRRYTFGNFQFLLLILKDQRKTKNI